jgi:hypothetical protein
MTRQFKTISLTTSSAKAGIFDAFLVNFPNTALSLPNATLRRPDLHVSQVPSRFL